MKNDRKKRILSAQLVLILLMILWCGTCFESKESQRQMEAIQNILLKVNFYVEPIE